MRMIHSVHACIVVRGRFYIEHVAYNRRLCAFTAQKSDSRTFHTDERMSAKAGLEDAPRVSELS